MVRNSAVIVSKVSQRDSVGVTGVLSYIVCGGFMSILAAIRREEKKLQKQVARLQYDLRGLQSAARALGKSTSRNLTRVKKRVMSAAAKAKISKAAKKRWAKIRVQAKKAIA